ncbi:MAG: hypothetical protein JO162_01195, partial [Alphaproteobacteria bacterium]|nr:hypothetical protein [Alphaproteobacteria bacterium]
MKFSIVRSAGALIALVGCLAAVAPARADGLLTPDQVVAARRAMMGIGSADAALMAGVAKGDNKVAPGAVKGIVR